jgi:hypothetical protein
MLSKDEQRLVLEMYREGKRKPGMKFTRQDLKDMGFFTTEPSLSRAITNLYYHFLIEENRMEYPKGVTRDMLNENIVDLKELEKTMKDSLEKMGSDTFFASFPENFPSKQEIVDRRMKKIWEQRREYRQTPKDERISYSLPPEGEHFGRLLDKAQQWIDHAKTSRKGDFLKQPDK